MQTKGAVIAQPLVHDSQGESLFPRGPMDTCYHHVSGGPLLFYPSFAVLTAFFRLAQIEKRWRAVAPEDTRTTGSDRVRYAGVTLAVQIPLSPRVADESLGSPGCKPSIRPRVTQWQHTREILNTGGPQIRISKSRHMAELEFCEVMAC